MFLKDFVHRKSGPPPKVTIYFYFSLQAGVEFNNFNFNKKNKIDFQHNFNIFPIATVNIVFKVESFKLKFLVLLILVLFRVRQEL